MKGAGATSIGVENDTNDSRTQGELELAVVAWQGGNEALQ
jgi:hypothetical protein